MDAVDAYASIDTHNIKETTTTNANSIAIL